jgi:hypothetical protein
MARLMPVLLAVLLLAGGSDGFAQTSCQPTLTQPCAPAKKPIDQSSQRPAAKSVEEPTDRSKRIRIDKDTDLNFGIGGVGVGRRF